MRLSTEQAARLRTATKHVRFRNRLRDLLHDEGVDRSHEAEAVADWVVGQLREQSGKA